MTMQSLGFRMAGAITIAAVGLGQANPPSSAGSAVPRRATPATKPAATQAAFSLPAYRIGTFDGLTGAQVHQLIVAQKATDEDLLRYRSWEYTTANTRSQYQGDQSQLEPRHALAAVFPPQWVQTYTTQMSHDAKNVLQLIHPLTVRPDYPSLPHVDETTKFAPGYDWSFQRFAGIWSPYAATAEARTRNINLAIEKFRHDLTQTDFPPELQKMHLTVDVLQMNLKALKNMQQPVNPYEEADDLVVDEVFPPTVPTVAQPNHRIVRLRASVGWRPCEILTFGVGGTWVNTAIGIKWLNIGTEESPEWYPGEIARAFFSTVNVNPDKSMVIHATTQDLEVTDIATLQRLPAAPIIPFTPGAAEGMYPKLPPDLANKPGAHQGK